MLTRTLLISALLLTLTACGGEAVAGSGSDEASTDAGGAPSIDCPPLVVKIDGEAVDGLGHGLALLDNDSYGVEVFNHAEATCADLLAGSRDVPKGEVNVRAFVAEGASRGSVSVGSKTNFVQGVELARKAQQEGDQVAICVSDAKWTSGGFGGDGPTYEISGLFSGRYCGER